MKWTLNEELGFMQFGIESQGFKGGARIEIEKPGLLMQSPIEMFSPDPSN